MNKYLKILVAVIGVGLLLINGCKKEEEETVQLQEIKILSVVPDEDFSSTGEFSMHIIPQTTSGGVYFPSEKDIIFKNIIVFADTTLSDTLTQYNGSTIDIISVINNQPSGNLIAVALNMDGSGSMKWNDSTRERVKAAKEFIRKLISHNASHKAAIFEFTTRFAELYKMWADFTSVVDTPTLFSALDSVGQEGGTPLYYSTYQIVNYMDTCGKISNLDKNVLVLTDGEDTYGIIGLDSLITTAQNKKIKLFAIGFGEAVDRVLEKMTSQTGGIFAHADSAGALQEVFDAMVIGLTQGSNILKLKFVPPQNQPIPPSGSVIKGTIEILGKEADWYLRVK